MACSDSIQGCMKHPNNQQLPGVCPSCLRERLYQLFPHHSSQRHTKTTTKNYTDHHLSPNFYSPYSFSLASSPNSLSPVRRIHHRNASLSSESMFFTADLGLGLKKSRSIAYVRKQSVGRLNKETKRSRGFWSKLLHFKGKFKDSINLVHPRNSFREILR